MTELEKKSSRYSTRLVILAAVIASVPSLAIYLRESWFFLAFIPLAWAAFLYFGRRDLLPLGFAESPSRRLIGKVGLLLAFPVALIAAVSASDKLGVCALTLALSSGALLLYGFTPATRVIAVLSLLWVACELPFGIQRQVHSRLAETVSSTASSTLDWLGVMHSLNAEGLVTENVQLAANLIIPPFDSVWLAVFAALTVSVWNRRPLLAGSLNLVLAVLIYFLFSTYYVAFLAWMSSFTDAHTRMGEWTLLAFSIVKIVLQVWTQWMCDRGIARLSLPIPVNSEESTLGLYRLYATLALWPAGLSPERNTVANNASQRRIGHEKLIQGCHSPLPPADRVAVSTDPFQDFRGKILLYPFALGILAIWIGKHFWPDLVSRFLS